VALHAMNVISIANLQALVLVAFGYVGFVACLLERS
jgi:hypothetical protein